MKKLAISGKEYYYALSSVNGVNPLSYLCSSLIRAKEKRFMKCAQTLPLVIFSIIIFGCATIDKAGNQYGELEVSIPNLRSTVNDLTRLGPNRNYLDTEALNSVVSYLGKRFSAYGLRSEVQTFKVDGREYSNLIATLNADGPTRIIVGAHYDVYDDQPGADDNASGVAALLEVARLMNSYAAQSNYRFDFVAYTLEEPPYFDSENMGSYIHAKSMSDQRIKVRAMISLEMPGYFTDKENSQKYPFPLKYFYPKKGNFIAVVGNCKSKRLVKNLKRSLSKTSLPVSSLSAPKSLITGVGYSDHSSYWKFGYKAVMVTDTSSYRNPNYHKATDTIETLDFEKMKEVVKGIVWALMNLD